MNEPEVAKLTLRVDRRMNEALRRFAERDARSIHSEILWILRNYIEEREAKKRRVSWHPSPKTSCVVHGHQETINLDRRLI